MPPKAELSYGGVAALASANSDGIVDLRHEDLAVADAAGMGRTADRLDRLLHHLVFDDQFDVHLGQEVDDVFGAAIEFGMSLLPSEPLGLQDGDALEPDLVQRILHLVELEGLDDRFDLLHLLGLSPHANAGAAGDAARPRPTNAGFMPELSTPSKGEFGLPGD